MRVEAGVPGQGMAHERDLVLVVSQTVLFGAASTIHCCLNFLSHRLAPRIIHEQCQCSVDDSYAVF